MAENTAILWIAALGFITLIMGFCVLYALRQVTVLREKMRLLTTQLQGSKDDQKKVTETLEKKFLDHETEKKETEKQDYTHRIELLEDEVQIVDNRMKEVEKLAQRVSAQKDAQDVMDGQDITLDRSGIVLHGGGSSNTLKGSGMNTTGGDIKLHSSADVQAVYEDILKTLRTQMGYDSAEGVGMGSPSAGGGWHNASMMSPNRGGTLSHQHDANSSSLSLSGMNDGGNEGKALHGLSLILPPPLIVFQQVSGGLYGSSIMKKTQQRIQLGVQDLEFVFTPISRRIAGTGNNGSNSIQSGTQKEIGGSKERADLSAVDVTGNANSLVGVSSNDNSTVLALRDIKEIKIELDVMDVDQQDCIKVTIRSKPRVSAFQTNTMTTTTVSSSNPREQPLLQPQASSSSLSFRRNPHETVHQAREAFGSQLIFKITHSPQADEWVRFVSEHCGDCVLLMMDGNKSTSVIDMSVI